MLSPNKVFYGLDDDIYVIDSTLVNKTTWNKYEVATRYTWNRYNTNLIYKWGRYTIDENPKYVLDRGEWNNEGITIDIFVGPGSYASSIDLSGNKIKIDSSDIKSFPKIDSQTGDGTPPNGYITSYRSGYTGRIFENISATAGTYTSILEIRSHADRSSSGHWSYDGNHRSVRAIADGYTNEQGDYVDDVSSTASNAYPSNGVQNGYWYVSAGSERQKGSANGTVNSLTSNAYPNDGVSGNYWYTYSGSAQEAGTQVGTVESYNSSAYPDDGIQDGYWYTKVSR